MTTASTLRGPSASLASVATRLESTPPLRPSTTRSKPTLRTSLRMNPTRIRLTSSGWIASGGKTGSERLAGALMQDSSQFIDGQFQSFVPEQGVGQAFPPHLGKIEAGEHERLIGIFLLGDDVAVRTDHHRAAPEVGPVFEADPVAVEKEGGQELGVGAADEVVGFRRSEALIGRDSPPRARRWADDHVHPLEAEDIGARQMPDVLADQYPGPAESRLEASEAVPRREVALLVEHPIGGQVDLAVQVHQ